VKKPKTKSLTNIRKGAEGDMANYERLMLTIPQEDLRLIRQLILNAKNMLAPIILTKGPVENHGSVNCTYLDVIALDRSALASVTLLRALPETLNIKKAVIYFSYQEFKTLLKLLEEGAASLDAAAGQYQTLWEQLDIAELNYASRCREQTDKDSAE